MALYICQGRYTHDAIKGMVKTPEDRHEPAAKLIEKAGGKLLSYYVTFGAYDWLIVVEAPNEGVVTACMAAAAAGGGVSHTVTTLAMTTADFKKALQLGSEIAPSFRSAGRS